MFPVDKKKLIGFLQTPSQYTNMLLMVVILGMYVRIGHVISVDFPLNDGGLFYSMIRELGESDRILPVYTSYNQAQIPYAYPPFSFFILHILENMLKVSLLDIMRMFPALVSCLTIPLFYRFTHKILTSKTGVLFSTLAFSFLPTSFDWLIVGAGVTRAPAFVFSLLALNGAISFLKEKSYQHLLVVTVGFTLVILTHPGIAWFTFYSLCVLFGYKALSERKFLLHLGSVMVTSGLLSSIWWLTIVQRHGWKVFVYPFQTESYSFASLLTPFTFLFTNEPFLDIFAVIGLLGLFISFRRKNYLIPVWFIVVFLLEPRLSAIYSVIPFSILVGTGFANGILPAIQKDGLRDKPDDADKIHWDLLTRVFVIFLLLYVTTAAYLAVQSKHLSREQIQSMKWTAKNSSQDESFIILTGTQSYGKDYASEWFPALSGRKSVTTPQGMEWLPDNQFQKMAEAHFDLQKCVEENLACLNNWGHFYEKDFAHIFISKKSIRENGQSVDLLLDDLKNHSSYSVVFENDDVIIFYEKSPGNILDHNEKRKRVYEY